jgi:hypothetical protein
VYISEQAAGLDSLNAPNSTYNATVANTVGALDTPSTNAIFYAAVIAYAGITDIATARYLWELIDDSQTADWVLVNDAAPTSWAVLDSSETADWALIPTPPQTQVGNSYGVDFFRSVATNGTKTIVVGSGNAGNLLSSSADLAVWDQALDGPFNVFNNIIYAQGKFYKFGLGLQSSVDGVVWTALTDPFVTGTTTYALALNSTIMVAVGSTQSAVSSDGGVTWTLSSVGVFGASTATKRNLIWNGTNFILGSGGGVHYSANGLTWTRPVTLTNASNKVADIAWDGVNKYVFVYWDYLLNSWGAYTSSNGVAWTLRNYSRAFVNVFWDGAQFVYVTFTYSIYTNDGSATVPVLRGTISGYRSPINSYALYKPLKSNGVYIWPGNQTVAGKYYFYTSTNFTTFSPTVYYSLDPAPIDNSQNAQWGNVDTI